MAESAIDRTSRALDLIPYISSHPGLTIDEIAGKFSTSPTQIFKDLEMLFMCGLPGYSHLELIDMELADDYVAINNPQNLDRPRKLSRLELTSITLGLDLITSLISDEALQHTAIALRTRFANLLATGSDAIAAVVDESPVKSSSFDHEIRAAIEKGSSVDIEYRSVVKDELSRRTIYPRSIYSERGHLYTVAYCLRSGEDRHFRNDRIISLATAAAPELEVSDVSQSGSKVDLMHVKVLLSPRNRFFLEAHDSIVESVEPHGQELLAVFTVGSGDWLLRELIALPGRVEVLGPQEFADDFYRRLDAILAQYR